jgi:hypothetical protein
MDSATTALMAAIDLLHWPARVRLVRKLPLPDGVPILLRIVAGEEEAIRQAVAASGRSGETVHEAAAFFIEQILLGGEAEPYRVLGAKPDASTEELRRNMALLLRWLHPDRDGPGERSVFAARVTLAWDRLKTPERRAAYDALRRQMPAKSVRKRHRRVRALAAKAAAARLHRAALVAGHHRSGGSARGGLLRRAFMFLFGGARP